MKFCGCRFGLALAIAIIALIWWPATWAKFVIVIGAGLLAVAGLFPAACCCARREIPAGEGSKA